MTIFDIKAAPYLAVGDYATDDTASIQSAINDAANVGGRVVGNFGRYRTSSPLIIPDRVTFEGDGYADDSGAGYTGSIAFNPNLKGTIIYPGSHDAFQITGSAAVKMSGFQVAYNQSNGQSGLGLAAIRANPTSGINTRSVFRDICISNSDYGMVLNNLLGFKIDNVNIMYGWNGGIATSSPIYPSWGDSSIHNCEMWGHGAQTNNHYAYHIANLSGGGLRINNCKLNSGDGIGGSGILLNPNLTVQQTMEPIIITGCSLEGQAVGVNIVNNNPAHGEVSEVSITGGNIWAGINAIRINTNGTAKWVNGLTATGINLMVNGGSGKVINSLDNLKSAMFSGNTFNLFQGGTGWGTYLGANTTNINVQSNNYMSGLVPVFNSGIGNTIGGGSS